MLLKIGVGSGVGSGVGVGTAVEEGPVLGEGEAQAAAVRRSADDLGAIAAADPGAERAECGGPSTALAVRPADQRVVCIGDRYDLRPHQGLLRVHAGAVLPNQDRGGAQRVDRLELG